MSELRAPGPGGPETALVRHYLTALNEGQVLDALSAFSMDAQMRDASGRERHGIREIAAAFANRPRPLKVDVDDVRQEGETVAVRMRMSFPEDHELREFQGVFRVSHERIRSVTVDPVPSSRSRRSRLSRTT